WRTLESKFTGKPDELKDSRPVWRGVLGKVPLDGNSPGSYSTKPDRDAAVLGRGGPNLWYNGA
ncbi:MAG: hypothetical protein KBF17_11620, partial [Candidatus Promineofilum sp.]|nr:hypothetical protein [Promineifilum sp.]MBP9658001.1 hypothetical protein [Promineifilum sp.]